MHSNNTWDSGVAVDDADFLGLDVASLAGPRKADGDLPDVPFLHLAPGSDLINAGVVDTANGQQLPYLGAAPDLGPFERE